MTIVMDNSRPSESCFIETISRGYTFSSGSIMRPAEANWHIEALWSRNNYIHWILRQNRFQPF